MGRLHWLTLISGLLVFGLLADDGCCDFEIEDRLISIGGAQSLETQLSENLKFLEDRFETFHSSSVLVGDQEDENNLELLTELIPRLVDHYEFDSDFDVKKNLQKLDTLVPEDLRSQVSGSALQCISDFVFYEVFVERNLTILEPIMRGFEMWEEVTGETEQREQYEECLKDIRENEKLDGFRQTYTRFAARLETSVNTIEKYSSLNVTEHFIDEIRLDLMKLFVLPVDSINKVLDPLIEAKDACFKKMIEFSQKADNE